MFPVINIGPLAVAAPGLIILIGLWIGLSLSERYSPRYGIDPNLLYNFVLIILGVGLVGARLAFAARYPQAFITSPTSLISPNPSLLEPIGIGLGVIVGLIYARKHQLQLWDLLDALTPAFAVFIFALGLSQLSAGTAFGLPTELPWAIKLWGANRHPTQAYLMLSATLIFWLTWPGRPGVQPATSGMRFLIFYSLLAGAYLFIDAFRGDSTLLAWGIRSNQILSWLALASGLWGIGKRITPNTSP